MIYQPVIGLEVHVELKTKSKMFCGCPADYFGHKPNSLTCPVCLGLPGALPVPNKKAVDWTILLGLALDCQINLNSKFDRKNYFYPDLPKGYQITQYDQPLCHDGSLVILGRSEATTPESDSGQARRTKKIRIRRVHLEEDTGKLLHSNQISGYDGPSDSSLVDFNRSGVPLVEVVTEPDFSSSQEAKEFLKKLQLIIRYLDISDADMEKGSMRIEPSISLCPLFSTGSNNKYSCVENKYASIENKYASIENKYASSEVEKLPNYRVEVKNINSFRFAQKAIDYEIKRQTEILEGGGKVEQETRGWNEAKAQTVDQRTKEEAHDYRYFPEPDIPPMEFTKSQIENLKSQIPELPEAKIKRFASDWQVKPQDAVIVVENLEECRGFEVLAIKAQTLKFSVAKLASLIVNKKIEIEKGNPDELLEKLIKDSQQTVLSNDKLREICLKVIQENGTAVAEFKRGKETSLQFLFGLVMRESSGRADPQTTKDLLTKILVT